MKRKWFAMGIILLFLGTCIVPTIAQNNEKQPLPNNGTWWRTYAEHYSDAGSCLQQTTDGGFIIAGQSSFYTPGDTDGLLIKTDANGIKIWDKIYGDKYPSEEAFSSVYQTSDGGYILAGLRYPPGSEYTLCWLVKTDAYGNEMWNKSYQFVEFSAAWSVVETFDEGFLVVGRLYHNPPYNSYALLFKVDKDGNEVWNRTYGGYLENEFRKIKTTADGGFIVGGVKYNESLNDSYPWLLKLDIYGEDQWNKTYISNHISYWEVYDTLQTNDGGYAIIGELKNKSLFVTSGWMMKTDKDGNEEWIREYHRLLTYISLSSFYQTSDGGFILTGGAFNLLKTKFTDKEAIIDLWISKTDETGKIQWSRTFNKRITNANFTYILSGGASVLQTGDGGYVVLGNSNSECSNENDLNIWLIKTNRIGLSTKTNNVQVSDLMNYRFIKRFSIAFPILRYVLGIRDL